MGMSDMVFSVHTYCAIEMQIIWLNSEAAQTIDFIVSSSTQITRQNCCSIISSVSPFLSVLTSGRIVIPLSLAAISLELFVDLAKQSCTDWDDFSVVFNSHVKMVK